MQVQVLIKGIEPVIKTISHQRLNQLRHPERRRARQAVYEAIKAQKLPHPSTLLCSVCGKAAEQYHHYHGYGPECWLDVQPICKDCHAHMSRPHTSHNKHNTIPMVSVEGKAGRPRKHTEPQPVRPKYDRSFRIRTPELLKGTAIDQLVCIQRVLQMNDGPFSAGLGVSLAAWYCIRMGQRHITLKSALQMAKGFPELRESLLNLVIAQIEVGASIRGGAYGLE